MHPENIVVVIPAYNPLPRLADIVRELADQPVRAIVVVNDGSHVSRASVFKDVAAISPKITVLTHGVNLGKGAALKTAFNHVLVEHPDALGVVTMDADGQHRIPDAMNLVRALAARPDTLFIGARAFSGEVPLRSRFGNTLTRQVFKLLVGKNLTDTQSGLRGIPQNLLPRLMLVSARGYDFELDMLIECKMNQVDIREVPIETIYEDGNPTSHFNPFLDSLRIYLVFIRFTLSSTLSSVIDYIIFLITFMLFNELLLSQFMARFVAGVVNCMMNYKFVFKSDRKFVITLSLYFSLLTFMGFVSYGLISFMTQYFGINTLLAKPIAEVTLYIFNFIIQRDFIFLRKPVLEK